MPALSDLPRDRLLVDASLWSADLGALAADVERMNPYADLFHVDATDGRFVPGLLFFPDLLAAVRTHTTAPVHVHLMAHDPAELAEAFAAAGADLVTVHAEADRAAEALARIIDCGTAAGIALTLDTPPEAVVDHLDLVDAVVMVGTPLGTKGTGMARRAPQRITAVRNLLGHRHREMLIFADGGIRTATVPVLAAAGADAVVAGSLLFASTDPAGVTQWLHRQVLTSSVEPAR